MEKITGLLRQSNQAARRQMLALGVFLSLAIGIASEAATTFGVKKKYVIPAYGELELTLQKVWKDRLKPSPMNLPPTIEISPNTGQEFVMLLTPVAPQKAKIEPSDLRSGVQQMSRQAAAQSVEKKALIKEFKGEQAEGYYFSLTDSAPAPGEYKFMTQGLSKVGEMLVSFTILSNDSTQKHREAGLEVVRTATYLKFPETTDMDIDVPNRGWKIHLLNPRLRGLQQQCESNRFTCSSRADSGFNLSLFVEKPGGAGTQHADVFDYYWPKASKNPLIDEATVKVEKKDKFVKVTYSAARMRNVNYYFAFRDRWVDVHISKLPFAQEDEKLFAAFDKTLSYGD